MATASLILSKKHTTQEAENQYASNPNQYAGKIYFTHEHTEQGGISQVGNKIFLGGLDYTGIGAYAKSVDTTPLKLGEDAEGKDVTIQFVIENGVLKLKLNGGPIVGGGASAKLVNAWLDGVLDSITTSIAANQTLDLTGIKSKYGTTKIGVTSEYVTLTDKKLTFNLKGTGVSQRFEVSFEVDGGDQDGVQYDGLPKVVKEITITPLASELTVSKNSINMNAIDGSSFTVKSNTTSGGKITINKSSELTTNDTLEFSSTTTNETINIKASKLGQYNITIDQAAGGNYKSATQKSISVNVTSKELANNFAWANGSSFGSNANTNKTMSYTSTNNNVNFSISSGSDYIGSLSSTGVGNLTLNGLTTKQTGTQQTVTIAYNLPAQGNNTVDLSYYLQTTGSQSFTITPIDNNVTFGNNASFSTKYTTKQTKYVDEETTLFIGSVGGGNLTITSNNNKLTVNNKTSDTITSGSSVVIKGSEAISSVNLTVSQDSIVNNHTVLKSTVLQWDINRKTNNLTLDSTSGSATAGNSVTFNVSSNPSGGTITAKSSDTNKATVSVTGNTITVTTIAQGSVTITVESAQTRAYNVGSKTYALNISAAPVEAVNYYYYAGWTEPTAENIASLAVSPNGDKIDLDSYAAGQEIAGFGGQLVNDSYAKYYMVIPDKSVDICDGEGTSGYAEVNLDLTSITIPNHLVYITKKTKKGISGISLRKK